MDWSVYARVKCTSADATSEAFVDVLDRVVDHELLKRHSAAVSVGDGWVDAQAYANTEHWFGATTDVIHSLMRALSDEGLTAGPVVEVRTRPWSEFEEEV